MLIIGGCKVRPIGQGFLNGFRLPFVPINDFLSVYLGIAILQHDHIAIVVACISISRVSLSCIPRPDVDKANHLVSCFVVRCSFANVRSIFGFHEHQPLVAKS